MIEKRVVLFFILLTFIFGVKTYGQDQIINSGDEWEYYDSGNLRQTWYKGTKRSIQWKTGISPIGYGDGKVITEIYSGSDIQKKDIVKYFKKTITLENPNDYLAYGLQIKRDDGIIIYLNGNEVFRNNLPSGRITNVTLALSIIEKQGEVEPIFAAIDPDKFLTGENTFAIEVHQVSQRSSDCIFDLEMFGYKDPKILSSILNSKTSENKELESQIKNLNASLLLEKSALKLEMQETRVESLRFILFIIGFLLMIALGIVIFLLINFRKKDQKLNNQIDFLKSDIRDKEHELMSINTKLLHNKQYFKEIKADIKGLKGTNDSIIKDITYHINLALESDEDWANFQKHFNAVYSGFYDILLKRYSSLTEIELRHCMFIKLHMQTKEIAKILLIDPRSVQTARYRIKKKMNLSEETDLRAYLLSIS